MFTVNATVTVHVQSDKADEILRVLGEIKQQIGDTAALQQQVNELVARLRENQTTLASVVAANSPQE